MYMELNCIVEIPVSGKVSIKKIKDKSYVYYQYENNYRRDKGYNETKRACIGKVTSEDKTKMYPNGNYLKYFPEKNLPELSSSSRSSCLKIGAYTIIEKIIKEYDLDNMLKDIIGDKYGLFLDLIAYTIIYENNASQYYPDYTFNHPLFTENMKMYSDSTISDFLKKIKVDDSIQFLNSWNEKRDHQEKIYISYDSTNKKCQAGDIEFVETGHSKDGIPDTIINTAIAYDRTNRIPLLYEMYGGSITDIVQLGLMVNKIKDFGYKKVGFILDRGYFSEPNIHYMDNLEYDFIIMLKGKKALVKDIVLEKHGTFEDNFDNIIPEYEVSGTSVKRPLFKDDQKERCIHVYYDSYKAANEKAELIEKIKEMQDKLNDYIGENPMLSNIYRYYFDLIYWHEGKKDQKLTAIMPRKKVIEEDIKACGYFCIVTSSEISAKDALLLYKSRDDSEKLFRGDKSYLGEKAERVYSTEAVRSKVFIEFVALIVRNKIYIDLIEQMKKDKKKYNYMSVPAAIRELEKIEIIRYGHGDYRLDHALSKTQKTILKAFNLDQKKIVNKVKALNKELLEIENKEKQQTV